MERTKVDQGDKNHHGDTAANHGGGMIFWLLKKKDDSSEDEQDIPENWQIFNIRHTFCMVHYLGQDNQADAGDDV